MATTFQYPQFLPPGTRLGTPPNFNATVNSAIPSFPQLNTAATNNISAMLSGLPSTSTARRANAFFGQQSGMPGSDFVRNRGFDLYNTQADQYQQQGFDNFLKMLAGYSGTVMPTTAQQIDQDQFAQTMDFRNRQAAADRALQERQFALEERKNAPKEYSWTQITPGPVPGGFRNWKVMR